MNHSLDASPMGGRWCLNRAEEQGDKLTLMPRRADIVPFDDSPPARELFRGWCPMPRAGREQDYVLALDVIQEIYHWAFVAAGRFEE